MQLLFKIIRARHNEKLDDFIKVSFFQIISYFVILRGGGGINLHPWITSRKFQHCTRSVLSQWMLSADSFPRLRVDEAVWLARMPGGDVAPQERLQRHSRRLPVVVSNAPIRRSSLLRRNALCANKTD